MWRTSNPLKNKGLIGQFTTLPARQQDEKIQWICPAQSASGFAIVGADGRNRLFPTPSRPEPQARRERMAPGA
jgi:hypothetical protein